MKAISASFKTHFIRSSTPTVVETAPSPLPDTRRAAAEQHEAAAAAAPPRKAPSPPQRTPSAREHAPSTSSKSAAKLVNHEGLLNGIGPYHFIRPLGNGKFSKVMLAKHQKTKKLVAIKIIDKLVHDFRVMSRLVREIHLMELLEHPNIVKLYETFETCDSLFLVMEYIHGQNLDEYLHARAGALPESEARHLFRQLVQAVHVCHRHWIVHRDLKTPNIMIADPTPECPQPVLKLVDFGLGNRFGLQRLKTICGSMLYYSPEIISNQKYYGPEVDCWCLGIALFRMTAGFEPFAHAHTVGELKKDVCSCNFPMPASIGPDLQRTIMKCLQVDRRKRMTVRMALQNDPWLTAFGDLPCPLATPTIYDDLVQAQQADHGDLAAKDKERRTRRQLMKTMEMEKPIAARTLVYHPINLSTYFTAAPPSTTDASATGEGGNVDASYHTQQHPRYGRFVTNVEGFRSDLLQMVCTRTHQLSMTPLDKWQAIAKSKRLGFKASELSLSAMVQRMQDQIHYFQICLPSATPPLTINTAIHTPTSMSSPVTPTTTSHTSPIHASASSSQQLVVPGSSATTTVDVSSSTPTPTPMTMIAAPQSSANASQDQLPSLTLSSITTSCSIEEPLDSMTSSCDTQQLTTAASTAVKADQECMAILKLTCQLMGISYVEDGSNSLICILTLRDAPTPSTTMAIAAANAANASAAAAAATSANAATATSAQTPSPAPIVLTENTNTNPLLHRQNSKRSTTSTQRVSMSSASSRSNLTRSTASSRHRRRGNYDQLILGGGGPANSSFSQRFTLISQLTSSMTTSFFARQQKRDAHHPHANNAAPVPSDAASLPRSPSQATLNDTPNGNGLQKHKDGVAVFSITWEPIASLGNANKQIFSLRFSKRQGSTVVFKMACGWITGVMALDEKLSHQ
ncbi:kinase-like domain-containing protein [Gongronella butleri]|nr:kinase-like domain-containing protein [Gongronella butleri]